MTVIPLRLALATRSMAGMALTALVMVLTPGPNMMCLASRSIGQGRRAGLVSLTGTMLGFVVYMLMANVGLAIMFIAIPWLFIGFKASGVAYLGWSSWEALRPGGAGVFEVRELPRDSVWRLFRMGLVTNLLKPKAAIMYPTVISQFIDPSRDYHLAQGIARGLEPIAVSRGVNALIVVAAGCIAALLTRRPAWTIWQRSIIGTMLGAVTILLAREVPARARI